MKDNSQNTWSAKMKRTITSVLPVSQDRTGSCVRCGACCKLPNVCPFLKYDTEGKTICSVHGFRPLNCRKYPRTDSEQITKETCGFSFR